MNTGDQAVASQHKLLTTVAWRSARAGREYALEGSVFIAGAVVQWLRDGLGSSGRSAEVEALAAAVPDTGGVYLVPAFAGLGAPHWDPYARGTITRAHARHDRGPHRARRPRGASPTRSPTCWTRCRPTPASAHASCGWTAAPRPTTC